ncbi:expressed unknown protein [Seminavis robusta]|uniref:Sulfotransferase n=1 Tax=Seminavis robusta TaxID=568900 RepID=A0A9N8HI94_9STRA|nr:expressed unknown protein [Seminavis robusta]|eukprot:Sro610_g175110.1 n/a (312) ;mRNA; f:19065-20000
MQAVDLNYGHVTLRRCLATGGVFILFALVLSTWLYPLLIRTLPEPQSDNDLYYDEMVSSGMKRSSAHQQKFQTRKDLIKDLPKSLLFHTNFDEFGGMPISDEFAFLHIYKCGGTTVENMLLDGQDDSNVHEILDSLVMANRKWIAVVRDPIDHFLSGWAECGLRYFSRDDEHDPLYGSLAGIHRDYDARIQDWLQSVKAHLGSSRCWMHSHPQVNFMIHNRTHSIDTHIHAVGDLSELKEMVVHIGKFQGWRDGNTGRDASLSDVKVKNFPSRKDLLSKDTILKLCEFLQLDYFLLDFQPPEICEQEDALL